MKRRTARKIVLFNCFVTGMLVGSTLRAWWLAKQFAGLTPFGNGLEQSFGVLEGPGGSVTIFRHQVQPMPPLESAPEHHGPMVDGPTVIDIQKPICELRGDCLKGFI